MLGKVDLAAGILELAMNETSMQSLQEKIGLSSRSIATQVKMLSSKKLVDTLDAGKTVRITKRGIQFLDLYKSIRARYLPIAERMGDAEPRSTGEKSGDRSAQSSR